MFDLDRLKELIAEKGITIKSLEKELGIGNGTIARWSKSAPTADKLEKVADYFGVSVDYLLKRDYSAPEYADDQDLERLHKNPELRVLLSAGAHLKLELMPIQIIVGLRPYDWNMKKTYAKRTRMVLQEINEHKYSVRQIDGAEGMLLLPDRSIKLVYGSPPYPNAERKYGIWRSSEYIEKMAPFLDAAYRKLRDDGFIVINVKANREKSTAKVASKRSLVIEKLAIEMEETWGLYCVDIEIWIKENPAPTGLRVACQDAYEQNLWFSKSPKWSINLDAIRRPYESHSVQTYESYEYKPRSNGNTYFRKNKRIAPNPLGALPKNILSGGVSSRIDDHPATQPLYLPEKYIKATTEENDLVVDPWMGSGTTGYAALTLGRRFAGFDVVEYYVAQANSRLRSIAGGIDDGKGQKT